MALDGGMGWTGWTHKLLLLPFWSSVCTVLRGTRSTGLLEIRVCPRAEEGSFFAGLLSAC